MIPLLAGPAVLWGKGPLSLLRPEEKGADLAPLLPASQQQPPATGPLGTFWSAESPLTTLQCSLIHTGGRAKP